MYPYPRRFVPLSPCIPTLPLMRSQSHSSMPCLPRSRQGFYSGFDPMADSLYEDAAPPGFTRPTRPENAHLPLYSHPFFSEDSLPASPASLSSPFSPESAARRVGIRPTPLLPFAGPPEESFSPSFRQPLRESLREPMREPMRKPYREPMREPYGEPYREPMREPMRERYREPMREPFRVPSREPCREPNGEFFREPRQCAVRPSPMYASPTYVCSDNARCGRRRGPRDPSLKERKSFNEGAERRAFSDGVEEVAEHSWSLRRLLSVPVYRQLWTVDRGQLYQESLEQVRNDPNPMQQLIRRCIVFKKRCQLSKARLLFLEMVVHNPSVTQYWIEFTRMEMETGCYANARLVVDTGLRLAPNNIFLLTKKLKIADKQGDADAIEAILDSLFASDRQKAIRVLVEAVSSLARLGRFGSAMAYVQEAMKYPAFFTGWFLCELIVFVVPTFSVAAQLDLIPRIAGFALKHSPLWALCLDLQEHITALRSPLHSAPTLPADPQYDALCRQAFAALSSDSVWKVYQIRVLRGTRILTLLRIIDSAVWNAPEAARCDRALAETAALLMTDAHSAISSCPAALRWKVFMTLGRAAAMLGQPITARAVGVSCEPDT